MKAPTPDIVVFDSLDKLSVSLMQIVHDLPGGAMRLRTSSTGVDRVLCNGREASAEGAYTGDLGGRLLRAGRDTVIWRCNRPCNSGRHGEAGGLDRSAGRSDLNAMKFEFTLRDRAFPGRSPCLVDGKRSRRRAAQRPTGDAGVRRGLASAASKQWRKEGIAIAGLYGGRGLSLVQQMVWYEEYARCGAPVPGCMSVGLNHGGPTLIARGTNAQKPFHIPPILRGDVVWCQGFSEQPSSGSDLGSIRHPG